MKRTIAAMATTIAALLMAVTPAAADHLHSKQTGNGACVVLAAKGGEKFVNLPGDDFPDNRDHPIHKFVHLGRAGQNFEIGVFGTPSDPCFESGDYLNYP